MTLTGTKHIVSRFRCALSQYVRGTCKIAVEVDAELLSKLDNNTVKPRRHPGIVKVPLSELPPHITKALRCVVGDKPVKSLLRECKRLNQYLCSRHPPPEQDMIRSKRDAISEVIDKEMPNAQLAALTVEQQRMWSQRRENKIKKRMQEQIYSWKPINYGSFEALAYAIGRGAQEYAVLSCILKELVVRDPQFKPRSYFDFGSGVGTGMWAVSNIWKDSIFEYYNVDSSREMHDLSELILRDGKDNQEITLRNVFYRQFLPALETKYDLVLSSYSLFELPSAQHRRDVIMNLWKKCDGYLIIVEEGTRCGSELVNEARDYVLNLYKEEHKGCVFAPCPHNAPCPRLAARFDTTPCNFEISYAPLYLQDARQKSMTTRYSYVVLKKGATQDPTAKWPRLVRPTLVRTKHAICRMCTGEGKLQEIIFTRSKHGTSAYRCAKASNWGDRLPIAIGEKFETEKKVFRGKQHKQVESEAENENVEDNKT